MPTTAEPRSIGNEIAVIAGDRGVLQPTTHPHGSAH